MYQTLSSLFVDGRMNFENINLKGEYKPLRAYAQSKLANVLFTKELARRLGSKSNYSSSNNGVILVFLNVGLRVDTFSKS